MKKYIRSALVGMAAIVCLTVTSFHLAAAAGDPRPSLKDFLSVSTVNELVARVGLLFVRYVIDLTYQDTTYDPYTNRSTVSGVVVRPTLPWDHGNHCQIMAERLSVSGAELGDWDRLTSRLELIGVTAPLACLPPEAVGAAAVMEITNFSVDRVFVDIDYRMSSSAMRVNVHMTLPDLAAVTANLNFAYVAIHEEGDEPVILELRHAAVTLDDMGLWKKAKKSMPPEMTQPDTAALMVARGLTELFIDMNQPPAPNKRPQLDLAQAAFVQSAAAQVQRFVAKPGTFVIETALEQPVRLNERTFDDPNRLFTVLKPVVVSQPASRQQIVPTSMLKAALTAPDTLSDRDKLRVGQALVSGVGAPRALTEGQALLKLLADAGNGEAALALSSSMRSVDPEAAYRLALNAGANSMAGASGIMDRLEQDLTTRKILTLQARRLSTASTMPSPQDFVPLTQVRAYVLAHLSGNSAVRSYVRAYYWALLGKAAGDQAAASMMAEIEARMRHRGPKAAAAWQAVAEKIRTDALAHWLAADYPTKLARQ